MLLQLEDGRRFTVPAGVLVRSALRSPRNVAWTLVAVGVLLTAHFAAFYGGEYCARRAVQRRFNEFDARVQQLPDDVVKYFDGALLKSLDGQ